MIKFDDLYKILDEMNFDELRKRETEVGMAATEETMRFFVRHLNNFFDQFKHEQNPNQEEQQSYKEIMNLIIEKINKVEIDYYHKKYVNEKDDEGVEIDLSHYAIKLEKLPDRMQHWAANKQYGGSIINAKEHHKAVGFLQSWPNISRFFKENKPIHSEKNTTNQDENTTNQDENTTNQDESTKDPNQIVINSNRMKHN